MRKMNIHSKAYIFDLDGTLLDSMSVWTDIDKNFLKNRKIPVPKDFSKNILGMNFSEAAAYVIERFNLRDTVEELIHEWKNMAEFAYENTVQMKPYAKEFLADLRASGAKLAVATSLARELYEPALKKQGIYDWFDAICDSDEAGCGKSRPDIFLLTAKKLGVNPEDCVVFEDILAAVESAKSIGMKVFGVFDKTSQA
ncbi:MAG: HAD family phosphatase, partial [Defluviitaleaceae bacterium]|nr:HAD family phosphatase [Defluviitaleaceae bacterium]